MVRVGSQRANEEARVPEQAVDPLQPPVSGLEHVLGTVWIIHDFRDLRALHSV
jgi:hypothetical protein